MSERGEAGFPARSSGAMYICEPVWDEEESATSVSVKPAFVTPLSASPTEMTAVRGGPGATNLQRQSCTPGCNFILVCSGLSGICLCTGIGSKETKCVLQRPDGRFLPIQRQPTRGEKGLEQPERGFGAGFVSCHDHGAPQAYVPCWSVFRSRNLAAVRRISVRACGHDNLLRLGNPL